MSGKIFVTQYTNYGDVQWETVVEPNQHGGSWVIGDTEDRPVIVADTHMVLLFASMKCRVAFVPDSEDPDDPSHEKRAWPLPPDVEVLRICHQATKFTVVTFPGYGD